MENTVFYRLQPDILPYVTLLNNVTVTPPYVHFRRRAADYILYYILSGEMHLTEQDRHYLLKPNDVILLDPSHEHYGTEPSTCTYFYIHFRHSCLKECTESTAKLKESLLGKRLSSLKSQDVPDTGLPTAPYPELVLPKYLHIGRSSTAAHLADELYRMKDSHHDRLEHHEVKTGILLAGFLIGLSRDMTSGFLLQGDFEAPARSTRILHELLSFLHSSCEKEISGKYLEETFHCNFDYINRIFKKATGETIFVYLNRLRICRAKQLLSDGTGSISEVAEKSGFRDVYYFSKVFKKNAGTTPGAYRKQLYSGSKPV